MANESKKAKVRESGKMVEVYKHSKRGTWICKSDHKTEYKQEELIFNVNQ